MREILFRGQTASGEWVEGDLFINFRNELTLTYIRYPVNDIIYSRAKVFPETVGMYTGLCDKNGKKIFEGDILEFSDRLVEVFWHAHLGCWDCKFLKFTNKENGKDDMSPVHWEYKSIVIGNIHDNPEFLKGE